MVDSTTGRIISWNFLIFYSEIPWSLVAASNHALVEVAESKAKLRKLRQQLEEKTEQLAECREELDKLQVPYRRDEAVVKYWLS